MRGFYNMLEPKQIIENKDLKKIESHIKVSLIVGSGLIIIVLGSYFINFHKSISSSNEVWGTFGDFVGGTLNPILAALAFYWLIASIRLQLKELKDTRTVLEDTALHQKKIAELENTNINIQNKIFELQQLTLEKQIQASKSQQEQISLQNFENIFCSQRRLITSNLLFHSAKQKKLAFKKNRMFGFSLNLKIYFE